MPQDVFYHLDYIYITATLSGPKEELNAENLRLEWTFSKQLDISNFASGLNSL